MPPRLQTAAQPTETFEEWVVRQSRLVNQVKDGRTTLPRFENVSVGVLNLSRPLEDDAE